MAVMRTRERQLGSVELPEQLEGVYKVTEAFQSIAVAWESISTGAWSTAAIQSFAALARRVALDLSTLGCGALDRAVVDLVLALDALTVASTVSETQLARVDHALAGIRAVTMQRLLVLDLEGVAVAGGQAPALLAEGCARCASGGVCAILRGGGRHRSQPGF
ncbi:MAG TPA: hypothetical protein PKD53_12000 [Chloroflexaceae bacterium]|nr:hypothetical protein [Chloroflexaceae bacterium]